MASCLRVLLSGILLAGLLLQAESSVCAKPPSLIELKTPREVFVGKSIAHNDDTSWMIDQAGRLTEVPLKKVTSYRRVAPEFQRLSSGELKQQLKKELGPSFEFFTTSHYLICAPQGKAKNYGAVFEDLYDSFSHYFALRGNPLKAPEFLMVAIVFPDRDQFYAYCKKDHVRAGKGLLGYYHPHTNRTVLFDQQTSTTSLKDDQRPAENQLTYSRVSADGKDLTEALRDTMIHEATHQVAFNTGLHSRVGDNPRWVVEGLATTFESDELRSHTGGRNQSVSRINRSRLLWFMHYTQQRRKDDSLRTFIRQDDLFRTSTLDAYAEAWALTFYLVETQPARYARYLKTISARDPLKEYSADERERDFKNAFKTNLRSMEVNYLEFMQQLTQDLIGQN